MKKKLTRSKTDKYVGGVLGGFGVYLDIDPVLLRILFALFVLATGIFPGVIIYLIAWIIVPVSDGATYAENNTDEPSASDTQTAEGPVVDVPAHDVREV